jgi:hypothetical protein
MFISAPNVFWLSDEHRSHFIELPIYAATVPRVKLISSKSGSFLLLKAPGWYR